MDLSNFIQEAKKGVVTVEFIKIDTDELRIMPCTLNPELSNHNVPEILEQKADNDHLVVWAIDKQAWRSFRTNTVTKWYVGTTDIEGHPV